MLYRRYRNCTSMQSYLISKLDSSLLLKRKSNQNASAHLRWLFALAFAHEKNALMSGISSFKILLLEGEFFESIPRPIPSHSHRHSFHFSAKEMSRGLKDFLRKDGCLYKLGTPGRVEIFVEPGCLKWRTHCVGEIFVGCEPFYGQPPEGVESL